MKYKKIITIERCWSGHLINYKKMLTSVYDAYKNKNNDKRVIGKPQLC